MQLCKWILLLLIGCCLTFGCVPRYHTALDDIHESMLESSNMDVHHQSSSTHYAQPSSLVSNALMPSLSTNLPAANSAAEQRFDVSVKDVPARSFFMGLVQGTKYNMVVDPAISGTISLSLKNVTIQEALDAVQDAYGYQYQQTPYGFEVTPQELQTQIFAVNYLDIKRNGRSQTTIYPSQISDKVGTTTAGSTGSNTSIPTQPTGLAGPPTTSGAPLSGTQVETVSEEDFWKNLQTTLTTIVGNKNSRSVIVNPMAGIVIVHALPSELREVSHYLDSIQNTLQREVIIEAKILEVELDDGFQSGINWNALTALSFTQAGFPQPNIGGDFTAIGTFTPSAHNGSFQAVINMLETQGNVQVLSSPRLSTVNNEKALIKVGKDQFFVTGVTSNVTPTNGSTTNSNSVSLTPFFAGITLDITPQISQNGSIILHIHPSISTVKNQNTIINLGNQGAGSPTILNLPLALSTIRESDSVVRAENGQVVVLGGLMQNNTVEQLNSTPFLGKIPFLGALFRNTTQASVKSELVILLRPTLVNNKAWGNDINTSDARFQSLNRGFHFGSRPEVFGTLGEKFVQ